MARQRTDTQPQVVLVVNGAWNGESACDLCRVVRVEPDVDALASAIARVPIWDGSDALVVVRRDPPAVAAVGHLTPQTLAHLDTLGWQIRDLLPRIRRLGYPDMEGLVERLGDRLVSSLGPEFLRTASFTAIPRGGVIVLGMLSYALGLDPFQLRVTECDGPVVVVDDIAVTGFRLGEFLATMPDCEIIYAHLFSHPDLRRSVETWEQRKVRCVAAADLADHAPAHLGERYDSWRAEHGAPGRFWVGMPDHVVTPWGEPDTGLWDESSREMRLGLRLADDRSLGFRWARARQIVPVQVQQSGSGALTPGPDAIFGELGGDILVARTSGGPVVQLTGPAADLWRSILSADSLNDALSDIREVDRAALGDVVDRLTQLGILTGGAPRGTSSPPDRP